jgi:hypothetical protein
MTAILKKLDNPEINNNNNEKSYDFNKSSIIMNDIKKQNAIINWIKEKINTNLIKFELIFKMSENGTKSDDFHKKCDNKGPTLILIKTTKNQTFGGFTPLNWNNHQGYCFDKSKKTFIFSLDLMKVYNMKSEKTVAIICKEEGPIFGCDDFMLTEDLKKGKTFANKYCNFIFNNNLELTGGKGNDEQFQVEEFEVYKVIY